MNTLQHPYEVLSTTLVLGETIEKSEVSTLYQKCKWRQSQTTDTLANLIQRKELMVIRTDRLVVIDFDDTNVFNQALDFNNSLSEEYRCKFIVRSRRKGGHFYFKENSDVAEPIGHTKQSVLDFLTGEGHNVLAPTAGDSGKEIIVSEGLVAYNSTWNTFVSLVVLQNLPQQTFSIVHRSAESHSDDNVEFVRSYLANVISQQDFDQFYNIQSPIPQGHSNEAYKNLSTRLACDETINWEDYLATIQKFNAYHKRKTQSELSSEVLRRMKPNASGESLNGLWKFDKDKQLGTFSTMHKRFKTAIHVFYDHVTGEYLISYPDSDSMPVLLVKKSKTLYLDLIEKISRDSLAKLKRTDKIPAVETIIDYSQPYGYNKYTNTFNKAIVGAELAAFHGAKPQDYKEPNDLLEVCKFMWEDEYEYLLASTKYRYTHFKFSPVITFLQGAEGSGKDLTVMLLTKPFPTESQLLDAALMNDKHSNWQTEPNAIVSELGDWRAQDRDSLLAKMKTIAGSNGVVTYRGMQQTAITQQSLIKIWVTANKWVKLHTDPLSQRRIHPVFMPKPLSKELGGPYTEQQLRQIFSPENIMNFYYWLGNEAEYSIPLDQYMVPTSRHKSESYLTYIENTQSISDQVSVLLYNRTWEDLCKVFEIYKCSLDDLTWKYNKAGNIVIAVARLKDFLGSRNGGDIINKTLDRITSDKEGNKRLKFDKKIVEKFITIYGAPKNLDVNEIAGDDIELD